MKIMKQGVRLGIIVAIIISVLPLASHAEMVILIPDAQWVTVVNPDQSLTNDNGVIYSFGDKCTLLRGSVVTRVAKDEGNILLRYHASSFFGAECPDGTLFEVSYKDFLTMSVRSSAVKTEDFAIRARIRRLLEGQR